MRKWIVAVTVLVVAVAGSACATKGFVKTQVDPVNNKVETLGKSLEETQERTRANEGKIAAVDEKAGAAGAAAQKAQQSASAADAKAGAVGARVEEVDKATKRVLYTVTLSDEQGNFVSGKSALPETAMAAIDALVAKVLANPQGAYFEVEGHTDAIGPKELNDRLGLERAEVVKRYLYSKHQIPLHRINVISYGPDKPVGPNNTKAGRAQNRRVVIRVLS